MSLSIGHPGWLATAIAGRAEVRVLSCLAAGAAVGVIGWGRSDASSSLMVICLLPILWGMGSSRVNGIAVMAGYFGAASRGLPSAAVVFFGDAAPAWFGWALWAVACAVLCLPYALCWREGRTGRGVSFVIATLAVVVPPIGVVGWLNPLSVAGELFPAWGWGGLALTALLLGTLAARRPVFWVAVAGLVVAANLLAPVTRAPPDRWLGFDTAFERLSSDGSEYASQLLASAVRIRWLIRVIEDVPPGAVLVLPETLIGRLDGVAESMLSDAGRLLREKGSRVLVGAELPDGSHYRNAVVVLGAGEGESRTAIQSIPVPISMWRPWSEGGARADLLARANAITVLNRRVGVSVCYEQLLAYSLLRLMWDQPELVVAVSNVWWARATNVPTIQAQSVKAIARLFDVPVIFARNI